MRTTAGELSELIRSGSQQLVGALRLAASEDLDTDELTDLMKVAFSHRNQIDAALTGAIGALDRAAEKAPDGELTMGLPSVKNSCHKLPVLGRTSLRCSFGCDQTVTLVVSHTPCGKEAEI